VAENIPVLYMPPGSTGIIFYGGVGEIGGNKILIEDKDTRIMLDFGMSYTDRRRFFFDPMLSPGDERDLLEFGILPKIEGIYEFEESKPSIDAVFLSHAHGDHWGYISFLKRNIPIYCGETCERILEGVSATKVRHFESDIRGLAFHTFRTGKTIQIGSVEVTPCHVDHSIPGAYGFIVKTSEGVVAYTADFRIHGTKPQLTGDFIELAAKSNPEVMLAEGTNILGGEVSSESDVKSKLNDVVSNTKNIVLANFSNVDIDRIRTFYEVAKQNDRVLAISLKQAFVLDQLSSDTALGLPKVLDSDEHIVVFRRSKKRYYDWEERVMSHAETIASEELRGEQRKFVVAFSTPDFKELVDIRPEPGSVFVLSMSEPFNEEQEFEFERLRNWLDHFGLPMYHIHCSGHIMPSELKKAVEKIKPRKLFPIHTEYPGLYAKYMSDAAKVESPSKGRRYELRT
jgi:ribonuclease J